jgi:hypothetical protein
MAKITNCQLLAITKIMLTKGRADDIQTRVLRNLMDKGYIELRMRDYLGQPIPEWPRAFAVTHLGISVWRRARARLYAQADHDYGQGSVWPRP